MTVQQLRLSSVCGVMTGMASDMSHSWFIDLVKKNKNPFLLFLTAPRSSIFLDIFEPTNEEKTVLGSAGSRKERYTNYTKTNKTGKRKGKRKKSRRNTRERQPRAQLPIFGPNMNNLDLAALSTTVTFLPEMGSETPLATFISHAGARMT